MAKVTFDYSKAESFISNDEVNSMKEIAENAKKVLVERYNPIFHMNPFGIDCHNELLDLVQK